MRFQNFMSRIRYYDNMIARWMMRHFYILFFQFVLILIFFIFFFNIARILDLSAEITADQIGNRLLSQQIISTNLIVIIVLLNSFWMLYIFREISRLRVILKEISYNTMRRKSSMS